MILTALTSHFERLSEKGEVPSFGYSPQGVSYVIVLRRDGQIADIQPNFDTSGKKPKPRPLIVPRDLEGRTSGVRPYFLCDKTSYALGLSETSKRAKREHESFVDLHQSLLQEAHDEGLQALIRFLECWNPESPNPRAKFHEIKDTFVAFRLDGEKVYLHDKLEAYDIWTRYIEKGKETGLCLVTGRDTALTRLSPSIRGIHKNNLTDPDPKLVSFDKPTFRSYGKEQGGNAPLSEYAAFAYTTALNYLLQDNPARNQKVRVGDTTTVFWAEADNSQEAEAAESLYAELMDPPDDAQEAERLSIVMEKAAKGRPLEEIDPQLQGSTRFYVLGLAPNASRLAVRFWYANTLGDLTKNIGLHYRDLILEPAPWRAPPAVWRLLYETAAQRDAKNISPNLAGELMRAVITGRPYPRSLLATVIMRMRTDGDINGLRAALCKACLNRDHRIGTGNISKEVPMSLDPNETAPGYRLGRLFAVLEKVQNEAIGSVNASIADRFYASASATPAAVFGMLLNKAKSHLGTLRRKKGEGRARYLESQIGEIMDGLTPDLPRSLPLEEQGRFAVGYYHQRQAFYQKANKPDETPQETDAQ
ncbi:type I-C CRISPR-associated protein Cas8c/Csd1 [Halorhodospira halochloris]|uniref:type I-C CRISPR-associated protein Cas8c/Csd1 n=1 Tax=Halorhodospira halochloris TaxID=1052 RepID=UPI001EE8CF34|nr:type I-C CRISPR-associated protein Cas8c/Csd1 [Halorhodospira halochloris]MCG5549271.1 type I-C CRISPR-associated protein Cas8c/Csd1 [Halorhodospira halochloris]